MFPFLMQINVSKKKITGNYLNNEWGNLLNNHINTSSKLYVVITNVLKIPWKILKVIF